MLSHVLFKFRPQGAVPHNVKRYCISEPSPRVQDRAQPFLRGKAANEKRVTAITRAFAGIRIDKVRFDQDLVLRKPALDEFAAGKFGRSQKVFNQSRPGAEETVGREHCGDHGGCAVGTLVATVAHAAPNSVVQAFLANFSIAKKIRAGTQQSVVVQRLHHGHPRVAAGPIIDGETITNVLCTCTTSGRSRRSNSRNSRRVSLAQIVVLARASWRIDTYFETS